MTIGSWNVERLTKGKLITSQCHMETKGVRTLCIQETHKGGSEFDVTIDRYLVTLSGRMDERENAGFGVILSPSARRCLIGFKQTTWRWESWKMRVPGGEICVVSAYCPHSGYPLGDHQHFYTEIGNYIGKLFRNGQKLVFGDFNAKLYRQFPTEHDVIGLMSTLRRLELTSPNWTDTCCTNFALRTAW